MNLKKHCITLALAGVGASAGAGAGCGKSTPMMMTSTDFLCADHAGMGAKVGSTAADIDFRECNMRAKEAPAGDMFVDAIWWGLSAGHYTQAVTDQITQAHARFYMTNAGTVQLKTILPKGEICATGYLSKTTPGTGDMTKWASFVDTSSPFHDQIVLVTMRQSDLKQVLEHAFGINNSTNPPTQFPNKDGSFLLVSSNVKISADLSDYANKASLYTKPTTTRPGSLITSVTIDGSPIDLTSTASITFAAATFVAGIDIKNNAISGTAGQGGGVSAGFISDYMSKGTFTVVDLGKDATLDTTASETSLFRKWFTTYPDLNAMIDGRFTLMNYTPMDLCQ
jgi:hypothetical protein